MEEPKLKITPALVIDILKRRRWIFLLSISSMLILGIVLSFILPRVYEAKTLILVEGQKVPQNYVQSIVTEDTAQRINTISQQILSRTNLEKIIKDFDLYSGPDTVNMFMEDKVASLRKRISVDVIADRGRQTEAFTIVFKGNEPDKVMRVANGLATYFIDENLRVRESQAIGTSSFLEAELDTMRERLEEVEEKIKEYRRSNMGELPEQLETNLRILERLQSSLSDRQQNLRDAKARLADLNSRSTLREPSVVVIGDQSRRNANDGTASLGEMIAELEALQSRYTDKHPDIQRLRRQIAEAEAKANDAAANTGSTTARSYLPPEIRQQISDVQREIQVTEGEIENIRAQIHQYGEKTENIPKREQELLSLNRDYENIKATYESLLNRKLEAEIAVNMERRQKGEQFRVIDPARLPQRPIEPDLKKLFLLAVFAGAGIGCAIVAFLEFSKPTFRNPEDIESQYDLPVLASIPVLLQPRQIFWKKMNNAFSIVYAVIVVGLFGVLGAITVLGPEVFIDTFEIITGG